MREIELTYRADGVAMTGYLVDGSGGAPAPGVLIAHEALGRDERMTLWARKLGEQGYVAFALDLYGDPVPEPFSFEKMAARHDHMMATDGLMRSRALAALETLAGQANVDRSRLAAIGFCQGGIVVTELARSRAPIRCAIGFHPGLKRPAGSADGPIEAKLLMMMGSRDPVIPAGDRDAFAAEMDEKQADWQLHLFGGVGHTFTNPRVDALGITGFAYDSRAERRAWAMALSMLSEAFADRTPLA